MFNRVEGYNLSIANAALGEREVHNPIHEFFTPGYPLYHVSFFQYIDKSRFHLGVRQTLALPTGPSLQANPAERFALVATNQVPSPKSTVNMLRIEAKTDDEGNITRLAGDVYLFHHLSAGEYYVMQYRTNPLSPQTAVIYLVTKMFSTPTSSEEEYSRLFGIGIDLDRKYPRQIDWLATMRMYIEGTDHHGIVLDARGISEQPLVAAK